MVRNYELMRYLLGCNAYGEWPTKFNGGLFTFDPVYVDSTMTFTPDYRKWGRRYDDGTEPTPCLLAHAQER